MQIVSVLGLGLVLRLGIVSWCGPWATRVLFIYLFSQWKITQLITIISRDEK